MSDTPAWLKSMEHGGIGESRARAFLLDRFWVLERSVDIHGADYLIQRRLTQTNFLDRDPPRLGIIQVKFIQDAATNVYIKKQYVLSESGSPHEEFFLLVHTGREDEERRFLLSAKEITGCPLGNGESEGLYRLAGKRLITDGEFEVTSKTRALDRIEHALRNADFLKNRKFIGTSQYIKLSPDHIEHDFLLPLENNYGDIQKLFFEEKQRLQHTLFELEEITGAIGKILRTTDPQEAFQIFEEEVRIHIGNGGYGDRIIIGCDAFSDDDFLEVVKDHKRRIAKLKELGLAEPYFDLLKNIEKSVVSEVAKLGAIGKSDIVRVTVEYIPKTLKKPMVTVKRSSRETATPKVKESTAGRHVIYFKPRDWLSYEVRAGKEEAPKRAEEIPSAISAGSWNVRGTFSQEIDRHLLGEEFVSMW
ncbi:MAG: hypothetical protein JWQ49_3900 [Edaphobacter sp.]|nr:hypothetical protein [Edaphobacter sp.]